MADSGKKHVVRTDAIAGDIVHVYDGIEEADNQLPMWWLVLFFSAVVFAVAYWFTYHEYGLAPLPGEAYAVAKAAKLKEQEHQAAILARKADSGGLDSLAEDPALVAAGQGKFAGACAPCHGANAEGNIGPNLTDDAWLHGGSAEDIQAVIRDGVAAKGMPAWGATLGPVAVQELTAYLLSIRGTNVPGKEPQGEPYGGGAQAAN